MGEATATDVVHGVTVCIPTLGRPSLFERCLPSVLAQCGPGDRVVVAFHGAANVVRDPLLDDPRVTVVVYEGETVSSVRNAAAAAATTELIAFLDDDDEWVPEALERLRALMAEPGAVFGSGAFEARRPDGTVDFRRAPEDLGGLYSHAVALFHSGTFVVRREAFAGLGGYREPLRFGENFDFGLRLARALRGQAGAFRSTDAVVLRWNRSQTDYGDQPARTAADLLATYPDLLAENGDERAKLHAICGAHAWRAGRRSEARRHFARALRADPLRPQHWARAAASLVRPVGDRQWRPS
jgi:glycosyltransferase involved in cell wall biosynthesis